MGSEGGPARARPARHSRVQAGAGRGGVGRLRGPVSRPVLLSGQPGPGLAQTRMAVVVVRQ